MENLRAHFEEIIELTDDEFAYILSHFTPKKLKKHQYLIQKDDNVHHTYWVRKGLLKASYTDEKEKEHIIQFAMENWWITDYQAYFTHTKAIFNVDCLENTELLCLSYENREKLCREMQKVEHFFRKKANSGFVALQKRMLSLLSDNIKERYEVLLAQYPDLFQRVSKTVIASYLGVSRESLSRLHSK
ncbi:Crp/Fnr family transcriptional regulator [Chryseobacterium sp.]|uniref:Crp/Fnr family transcriptional regulator n=1 Tax=Chryseobacterium sp. TaxID=1871047 RepID=UPI001B0EFF99|nr:Crp/Fnr family transcriptional regulator [Chryseobacterium sp.]MBO9692711.1 Crp/Fnr family transcriptional regulator [Chryseobacterium sp.]